MSGEIGPHCEAPLCEAPTRWALLNGIRTLFDAEPSQDGTFTLRDTGGSILVANRRTTAQQFGRQGKLFTKHDCEEGRKWRHRRHR